MCGAQPDQPAPKGFNKLTQMWRRVLAYVKAGNFEDAYRLVLREGDDLYLLRLIVTTRAQVVMDLDTNTTKQVLSRLNKIVRGGVFELQVIDWLEESRKCGLFDKLNE